MKEIKKHGLSWKFTKGERFTQKIRGIGCTWGDICSGLIALKWGKVMTKVSNAEAGERVVHQNPLPKGLLALPRDLYPTKK
jgi:hypothetical protein